MAAPDTSFQPTPSSEEGHPGLELREHPVSPPPGNAGERESSYLTEIQRLALEANPADALDMRAARRA